MAITPTVTDETLTEGDEVTVKGTFKKRSDSTTIDLTGASVKFKWRINRGTVTEETATRIAPFANGQAQYQFTAGELPAGVLEWQWELTDGAGDIFNSDQDFSKRVKPQFAAPSP
jgi:hypothetical protein